MSYHHTIPYHTIPYPLPTQPGPGMSRRAVRAFARDFPHTLRSCLAPQAQLLREVKAKLGRQFCRQLLRRTTVNHLACSLSPMVIAAAGPRFQGEWRRLGGEQAALQVFGRSGLASPEVAATLLAEWSQLLGSGRRLEEVCMWVTVVVDRLVARNPAVPSATLAARTFHVAWTEFSSKVRESARRLRLPARGEVAGLAGLLHELVLQEVERLLAEETAAGLREAAATGERPRLEELAFVEALPMDALSRAEEEREEEVEEEQRIPSPDSTQPAGQEQEQLFPCSSSYSWHQPAYPV